MLLGYHELSEYENDVYALTPNRFHRHAQIVRDSHSTHGCISFDDGHISQFTLAAPILHQLELAAVFFVTTGWVGYRDAVMDWGHLRELSRLGHTIASHTHTHVLLTSCSDAALRYELSISKHLLEDRLGIKVSSISMPGGRVDARVLAACGEAGYQRVYTSGVAEYQPQHTRTPEVRGRLIVTRATTEHTLAAYMEGKRGTVCRLQLEADLKGLLKAVVGDSLYQMAWRRALRHRSYTG